MMENSDPPQLQGSDQVASNGAKHATNDIRRRPRQGGDHALPLARAADVRVHKLRFSCALETLNPGEDALGKHG